MGVLWVVCDQSYLAQERVYFAAERCDGSVSIAIVWSLWVPVVGVLFLHQRHGLLLEVVDDLGCARRRRREETAQEVRGAGDFE